MTREPAHGAPGDHVEPPALGAHDARHPHRRRGGDHPRRGRRRIFGGGAEPARRPRDQHAHGLPDGRLRAAGRGEPHGTQSRRATLTAQDVKALQDKTNAPEHHRGGAGRQRERDRATYQGATHPTAQGVGTTPNYLAVREPRVASGSSFTDDDVTEHAQGRRSSARPSSTTCSTPVRTRSVRGSRSGGSTWTVIGVLKSKGSNGFARPGRHRDRADHRRCRTH